MNKNELLLKIQQLSFAKCETELFLDTHPECSQALEYYRNAKQNYFQAASEYENLYGPLSRRTAGGNTCFNWLSQPMPWEKEA